MTYVTRRTHSLAEWCAIIDHELVNNRPIFYNGFTLSISGHAFVCDGADGNGFYHINWGWSGYSNGYFDITLLNCDEPETTTGNDGFNYNAGMVIGIKPKTKEGPAPLVKGKDIITYISSVSLSKKNRNNAEETFQGNVITDCYNFSHKTFTGWVALAVKEGDVFKLVSNKSPQISLKAMTMAGEYSGVKNINLSFDHKFPVGTTKVYLVYGKGENIINTCDKGNENCFYVNATETTADFSNAYKLSATLSAGELYTGEENDFTLSISNAGPEDYIDLVFVYISNSETKPTSWNTWFNVTAPGNNGTATRKISFTPSDIGDFYIWVNDVDGNPIISAQ